MKIYLLILLFLPLVSFSQQNYSYKNLVFEGGGIRGLAYAGALKVLEQKGIIKNIEKVAGTSAGAITAMMIGSGYTSNEVDSIFRPLKIQQFNDGKEILGKLYRLKKEYGIYKGDKFEKWLGKLLLKKTGNADLTFIQLHGMHLLNNNFKDVFCTGTNVSRQRLQIFSWQTTPGMKIKTAVHISGCIAVYFKAVALDSNWNSVSIKKSRLPYDLYVDGGIIANYPINIFDSCSGGGEPLFCGNVKYNPETLGLKLERFDQAQQFDKHQTAIASYNIKSVNQYITALSNLTMETLNRKMPLLENEVGRTIFIGYKPLSGRPRKISAKTKNILFTDGAEAAEKFFKEKK